MPVDEMRPGSTYHGPSSLSPASMAATVSGPRLAIATCDLEKRCPPANPIPERLTGPKFLTCPVQGATPQTPTRSRATWNRGAACSPTLAHQRRSQPCVVWTLAPGSAATAWSHSPATRWKRPKSSISSTEIAPKAVGAVMSPSRRSGASGRGGRARAAPAPPAGLDPPEVRPCSACNSAGRTA